MPLFDDFLDARAIAPEKSGLIQLSKSVNYLVGQTAVELIRPVGMRTLTIRGELGTIKVRPDKYAMAAKNFTPNNIATAPDSIGMSGHGLATGEGPFQITGQDAEMVPGTSVVIDEVADSFVRTVGGWATDGFWVGTVFSVAGSASNPGPFTVIAGFTQTVLNVAEDITVGEVAQTDLVITSPLIQIPGIDPLTDYWVRVILSNTFQLHSSRADALADVNRANLSNTNAVGRYNLGGPAGWAPAHPPTLGVTDGYGSLAIIAGQEVSLAAPELITLVGMGATDACSYWWSR